MSLFSYVPYVQNANATDCRNRSQCASEQTLSDSLMNEKEHVLQVYKLMYKAMVEKDTAMLNRLHSDDFVLIHMTGMRQSKAEYINSISNGTLNYFAATHEQMDISIDGDSALLTGRSRVEAAVFGGGRHTWRLQLRMKFVRRNGKWLISESSASTY